MINNSQKRHIRLRRPRPFIEGKARLASTILKEVIKLLLLGQIATAKLLHVYKVSYRGSLLLYAKRKAHRGICCRSQRKRYRDYTITLLYNKTLN